MSHRKLLLVAYHFPPIQGSTGTNRTLAFSKYLQQYGWDVCVLTIRPQAYERTLDENLQLIPANVRVERAWGVDARRSISIRGRYPILVALPDRWQSWIAGAFVKGTHVIRSWRPDVLMTTYPIASAHGVGYLLHKTFQIPWVAEFRDPMLQPNYPSNRWERHAFRKIEELTFSHATEIIVTTNGCRKMYLRRYPSWEKPGITEISNGYDPSLFPKASELTDTQSTETLVLLHSGLLYPHERDPSAFFIAVSSLKDDNVFDRIKVEFRFRASGNEEAYREIVRSLGIEQYVRFLPPLPYAEAVSEMCAADALMLFQADNCNDQIPAKVYEYLYCHKPIVAFVDPAGDTGQLLDSIGVKSVAKLENAAAITAQLDRFLNQLGAGEAFVVSKDTAKQYSRESLTGKLVTVLDRASSSR